MNPRIVALLALAACLTGCANYAVQPVLHPGTEKRHESFNEISKKGEAKLVFLGDYLVGPQYVPADATKENPAAPKGRVTQFVMESKECRRFNPGIA
ncbi:MAG: hypothetical protein ACKORI_09410, partial [Verrucomicrobiota bacterium]